MKEEKRCGNCLNKTKATGDIPCCTCCHCFGDKNQKDNWEEKEIDFENMSLEERSEMDEYNMLSQDLDDEGSVFDDKLEMYRNEI